MDLTQRSVCVNSNTPKQTKISDSLCNGLASHIKFKQTTTNIGNAPWSSQKNELTFESGNNLLNIPSKCGTKWKLHYSLVVSPLHAKQRNMTKMNVVIPIWLSFIKHQTITSWWRTMTSYNYSSQTISIARG